MQLPDQQCIGGHPVAVWGCWFISVGDGSVKFTNLHIFYSLGITLERLCGAVHADMKAIELYSYIIEPHNWLLNFLRETEDMPLQDSRRAADYLQRLLQKLFISIQSDPHRDITSNEVGMIFNGKEDFDKAFEREYRALDVFTVMGKGIYDTRALMTTPENELPERLRKFLPQQTVDDLRQAGKCLAFEVPTACAFHICRGTEALMLKYYEALAKHPWSFPKKDWKIYIEQLSAEGAPKSITTRLDEIREMDRNAYTHPDKNVSLDEAPVLFRLCTGVTFYMCEEIGKLTP